MLRDPRIRVYNAACKCSLDFASIMSGEDAQKSLPSGAAFSFDFPEYDPAHPLVESPFPSTNIEGVIRWIWYQDTAVIQIGAQRKYSDKLHSIIVSPPDLSKGELICWLRDKSTWPIMEQKWWELYEEAQQD